MAQLYSIEMILYVVCTYRHRKLSGSRPNPSRWPFWVEFVCSHCACMGFLQVLWFPHTDKNMIIRLTEWEGMTVRLICLFVAVMDLHSAHCPLPLAQWLLNKGTSQRHEWVKDNGWFMLEILAKRPLCHSRPIIHLTLSYHHKGYRMDSVVSRDYVAISQTILWFMVLKLDDQMLRHWL